MGTVRRVLTVACLTVLVFVASVYFTWFHHPPAAEILKNQAGQPDQNAKDFELDPNTEHTVGEISRAVWGKWLYQNRYVSVGDVFDGACGK